MEQNDYKRGFIPYGLAAFLIGIVGGFSAVLGPSFVQDIGIAYNHTTWTALAQAMSTAACAPILGKVGDVIGRRRTLFLGLAVFTLGNILTAMADSLAFMIVARFVVGIGSAAAAPVILAYIVTQFPQEQVAKGFSIYMLISSASVIVGPSVGSLLIAAFGWRVMVWVCVLICVVISAACVATAEKTEGQPRGIGKFDWLGSIWIVVFFSLLLCVPSVGQNIGWDSKAFRYTLLAAVISFGGLIVAEKRAEQPILPGSFIGRRGFVLSVLALFLTQGLMQANMTNTIVFLNYTQPEQGAFSGYAISVMYLGMSLGALMLGPLADRYEPKTVLTGSLLLTGLGCGLLFLFSAATPILLLMASLGFLGFGLGGNGTIFMRVALYGLPARKAGAGTGTYGLFRDLAAPFGVAVFVPMFTNQIVGLITEGWEAAEAAVSSVRSLAGAELLCIIGGMIIVSFLPKIRSRGNTVQE